MTLKASQRYRACLIVDNPLRDLEGLSLLGWHLAEAGCEVFLVPMYDQASEVLALCPDVVVVNYARSTNKARMMSYSRAGIMISVLDTEGGVVDSLEDYATSVKRNGTASLIDQMLLWGPLQQRAFIEHSGIPEDRLVLTGCPRMDFCSDPWTRATPRPAEVESPMVLVNTNFSLVNPRFASSVAKELAGTLVAGFSAWDETYLNQLAASTTKAMDGVIETTKRLASALPHVQFVLRPHPFENPDRYNSAFSDLPNCQVRMEGSVIPWVQAAEATVHLNCGSAVETVLMGKQAINLEWLNDDVLIRNAGFPREVSHKAPTFEATVAMLQPLAAGRSLKVDEATQEQNLARVKEWFHNGDGRASERAAASILQALDRRSSRPAPDYCRRLGIVGGRPERPVVGFADTVARRALGRRYPASRSQLLGLTRSGRMRRGKEFSASDVVEIMDRIAGVAESSAPVVQSIKDDPDVFPPRSATAIRISREGAVRIARFEDSDDAPTRVSATTEGLLRELTAGYFPRGLYFRGHEHKRLLRKLVDVLRPGEDVLDLGCGHAMRYRKYFDSIGVNWFGADLFHMPDVQNYGMVHNHILPYGDERFRAVACFNVIEHFDDVERMFSEIARVTAQGGLFAGACAFHEKEHSSYFHLSHLGLETIAGRYGFKPLYLRPSEYSGSVLASQRHFGGPGRLITRTPRMLALTVALGLANTIPFLITNVMEFLRRVSPLYDPFDECATLYFVFRKESEQKRR